MALAPLVAVSYSAKGSTPVFDKPRTWSETRVRPGFGGYGPLDRVWDLHPDGQRAVSVPVETSEVGFDEIVLRFGFLEQLRQSMPVAR
jgi:hypothetical protein